MSKREKIGIAVIGIMMSILIGFIISGIIVGKRENVAVKLLNSFIDYKSMTEEKKSAYKDDFMKKCLLARTVYQFGGWASRDTKLGKLNVGRWYCMSAEDYNDMLEKMWDYNKKISIPIDAWENYIPIAGLIFESGICEYIDHATGEIIRLAGYTEDGFRAALYYYMYECDMQPGNEWYLPELFQGRMSREQIDSYFRTWPRVLKFHYAYLDHLLGQYDYKWDWVETSFHFGLEKPDYWWYDKNLKQVPNRRLDGQWNSIWLPDYYTTVFEIAQGIASGNLRRISKWERRVEEFGKWSGMNNDYLWTLKLKFRSEEKYNELVSKVDKWKKSLNEFGELNDSILKQMAKMNDMVLISRQNKGIVSDADKQNMRLLKHQIESNWRKIKANSMLNIE
jgi:hypothetical protein